MYPYTFMCVQKLFLFYILFKKKLCKWFFYLMYFMCVIWYWLFVYLANEIIKLSIVLFMYSWQLSSCQEKKRWVDKTSFCTTERFFFLKYFHCFDKTSNLNLLVIWCILSNGWLNILYRVVNIGYSSNFNIFRLFLLMNLAFQIWSAHNTIWDFTYLYIWGMHYSAKWSCARF